MAGLNNSVIEMAFLIPFVIAMTGLINSVIKMTGIAGELRYYVPLLNLAG